MKPRTRRRICSIGSHLLAESLEQRALLAGDFAVIQDGDTLFIQGDDKDNSLSIQSDADGVTLVGLNGTNTTINGSSAPAHFSDVRHIHVEGMAGDDAIAAFFTNSDAEDLLISAGDGQDNVGVWTNAQLNIRIDSGNGADRVDVTSFSAYAGLSAQCGGGDILISTAAGDDELSLQLFQHEGNVQVDMGNGNDLVRAIIGDATGNLSIDSGNGNDDISIRTQSSFFGLLRGNLSLDGGNGQKDTLFVQSSLQVDGSTDLLDWETGF